MKLRPLAAATIAALLAACTGFKLTYNNLDWVVDWQIGRYVGLGPDQKTLLDDGFRDFWAWHRGTQLSLYAQDLREIAGKADRPMSAAQIEAYMDRSREHLSRAIREALPESANLLRTFDDGQVQELVDNLARRREKTRAEAAGLSDEGLKDKTERDMIKQLKRWVGGLDGAQKARVHRWAAERHYAGTVWMQYQEAWADAFTKVLAQRREPDFAERLAGLFGDAKVPYGAQMRQLQADNRRHWVALMADLSAMLDEDQRRHLRQALLDFAADLDSLAARG